MNEREEFEDIVKKLGIKEESGFNGPILKTQLMAKEYADQAIHDHPDQDWSSHYYGFIFGYQKGQE